MADVLIVCVREDEPLAKAFADMFERAGLHVGGAPGAVEDMRACGAALVVWSQASIRSRAFLDAAQRSVNAGKAVVACLIAPPPPASINHAPAFDLSRWTGDPDDPVLDPLFFAVDRMVAAQRQSAGVAAPAGAAPARADPRADPPSAYFTQPAPPPAPPYARARPSPPAPPPQHAPPRAAPAARAPSSRFEQSPPRAAPANPRRTASPPPMTPDQDLVAAEAQNWAAIRHSRNPEDFLRHLADYSASGAFAELAQMKLAELEAEARRRRQPPAAIARQDSLRGADAVRLDPTRGPAARAPGQREAPRQTQRPPPAQFEPIRSESPASSRRGAPPPRHEPPAWRDEGRAATRRPEPARGGGGGMRLILLILLLGGGALGLGLFAGDRFGLLGMIAGTDAGQTQEAAWQDGPAAAREAAASSETGGALDASEIAAAPIESGPRETAAPRAETRAATAQTPPREETRRPAEPQQLATTTTTTTTAAGTPAQAGASTPATILPPLPEVQIQSAAITQPPPAQRANPVPAAPTRPPAVVWTQRPSAAALGNLFPTRAVRSNTTGRVELNCLLDATGVPRCAVARETPSGYGFGAAALRAAAQFRARPTLDDGTASSGAQTRLTIVFRPPTL